MCRGHAARAPSVKTRKSVSWAGVYLQRHHRVRGRQRSHPRPTSPVPCLSPHKQTPGHVAGLGPGQRGGGEAHVRGAGAARAETAARSPDRSSPPARSKRHHRHPPTPRDPAPARRERQVAGAQPRGARDRAAHPHGPSRCTAADVAARRELRRTRVVRRPVAPSFLGSGRRRWGEGRRRRSAASSPAAEPAARRSSPPPPLENLGWETRWMGLVLRSPKSALISLGRPAARAEGSPGVPSRMTHHGAHAAHG